MFPLWVSFLSIGFCTETVHKARVYGLGKLLSSCQTGHRVGERDTRRKRRRNTTRRMSMKKSQQGQDTVAKGTPLFRSSSNHAQPLSSEPC